MARKQRIATPLSVAARTKRMLDTGRIKVEPVWYRPVLNTPPMADFAKKPAPAHQGRIRTKQTDIFEFQQVARGAEQHYRRKFYKQHPWELARPRILVEEDGADHVRQDWSRIEQIGKQLDGESVVQRTLYLMKELKTPLRRIWEVHGFDNSHARGQPLPSLPEYGNIPEVNRDADAVERTWNSIQAEITSLQKQVEDTEKEITALESEKQLISEMEQLLKEKPKPQRKAKSKNHWKGQPPPKGFEILATADLKTTSLQPFTPISVFKRKSEDRHYFRLFFEPPRVRFEWEELPETPAEPVLPSQPHPSIQLQEKLDVVYSHRRTLKAKIIQLESKARKMCRLQPEVAYLQACSEFYLGRQQEETETRIAMEQAKAFRRTMGPTVNEREFQKEHLTLKEWKVMAEREQMLIYDARAGGREGFPGENGKKEGEDFDETAAIDYIPGQDG